MQANPNKFQAIAVGKKERMKSLQLSVSDLLTLYVMRLSNYLIGIDIDLDWVLTIT